MEQFSDPAAPLPTRVLDINDREITEFFGDQNREPVTIDQIPKYLLDAVITREDRNFYHHHGFSVRGLVRAAFNIATGRYVSGGSTITQELAGQAAQPTGPRSPSSASSWSCGGRSRWRDATPRTRYWRCTSTRCPSGTATRACRRRASSSSSTTSGTIPWPNRSCSSCSSPARPSTLPSATPSAPATLQKDTLDNMVRLGYVTRKEAEDSFNEFWAEVRLHALQLQRLPGSRRQGPLLQRVREEQARRPARGRLRLPQGRLRRPHDPQPRLPEGRGRADGKGHRQRQRHLLEDGGNEARVHQLGVPAPHRHAGLHASTSTT